MAVETARKTKAMGCDAERIREAVAEGRTPPLPTTESQSGTGVLMERAIVRVTTNNPLCTNCDATLIRPGVFSLGLFFSGDAGTFTLTFAAFDQEGNQRCSGSTGALTVLGPREWPIALAEWECRANCSLHDQTGSEEVPR